MSYDVDTETSESQVAGDEYAQVAPEPAATPVESAKVNKSAEVRAEASRLIDAGKHPRPVEIVRALEERGITVAPAQVSIVLKKMGFRPLRKRKGAKRAAARAAASRSAAPRAGKPAASAAVSIDDLIAAKKVASSLGGTDKAIAALQALKRIAD